MSVPDPFNALRRVMLDTTSITTLLRPQTALPSLATAPIFAYGYPRQVVGAPQTGYTGHDWAALLHNLQIEMVVIKPAGRVDSGGDQSRAPWGRVRFDVEAYGRTYVTAAAVHWAIHDVLKALSAARATLSTGVALIHDVTVEAGPISFPDPVTECPEVVGTYAATVAEQHVAVA